MAKTDTVPTPPAPTPVPASVVPAFNFEDAAAFPLPEKVKATRVGGESENAKKVKAMPVGKTFLETVIVPANITADAERDTYFTDEARKLKARIAGTIRRLRAKDEAFALRNFAVEVVSDEKLGYGVRVWRNDDTPVTAAA